MNSCLLCGKEKNADFLSSKNICMDCLQNLFDQIQLGGKDQKKAIARIDSFSMIEKMQRSVLLDYWSLDQLTQEGQRGRYDRGLSKECKPKHIDHSDRTGLFAGSSGDLYKTSLTECSCYDFQSRNIPCKHMYRLAYEIEKNNFMIESDCTIESDLPKMTNKTFTSLREKTLVFSGTIVGWDREKLFEIVEQAGGKVSGSVSKKTDYLVAGEGPGIKYQKAIELGIPIIDIDTLLSMAKEQ